MPALARTGDNTCNLLMLTGSPVAVTCNPGTAPTGNGGTIQDGHYVLTKEEDYNSPGQCPNDVDRIDLAICGDEWSRVQATAGAAHINFHVTAQGNQLSGTYECPPPAMRTWTYDALLNGLVLYEPTTPGGVTYVATFTRQ